MSFVQLPNTPSGTVDRIICGTNDNIIIKFFYDHGIQIIQSDKNPNVDDRLSYHADIGIHHLGNNNVLLDISQKDLYNKLLKFGMKPIYADSYVSKEYPYDCRLNFARIGNNLIGLKSIADDKLIEYSKQNNLNFLNVKQGYGKCSTLVINSNSFITDDKTIYECGLKNKFNCIFIEKGDIFLDGYDYGFIGGCSGMIDKNHVVFLGDITKHQSYIKIRDFLDKLKVRFSYIENYPLTDIGGFIPISELL